MRTQLLLGCGMSTTPIITAPLAASVATRRDSTYASCEPVWGRLIRSRRFAKSCAANGAAAGRQAVITFLAPNQRAGNVAHLFSLVADHEHKPRGNAFDVLEDPLLGLYNDSGLDLALSGPDLVFSATIDEGLREFGEALSQYRNAGRTGS
jgi:hypothetical protein